MELLYFGIEELAEAFKAVGKQKAVEAVRKEIFLITAQTNLQSLVPLSSYAMNHPEYASKYLEQEIECAG